MPSSGNNLWHRQRGLPTSINGSSEKEELAPVCNERRRRRDGRRQDERCIRDNVLLQQGQGTFHTFMYDECSRIDVVLIRYCTQRTTRQGEESCMPPCRWATFGLQPLQARAARSPAGGTANRPQGGPEA